MQTQDIIAQPTPGITGIASTPSSSLDLLSEILESHAIPTIGSSEASALLQFEPTESSCSPVDAPDLGARDGDTATKDAHAVEPEVGEPVGDTSVEAALDRQGEPPVTIETAGPEAGDSVKASDPNRDADAGSDRMPRGLRKLEGRIKELLALDESGGQQLSRDRELLAKQREAHKVVRRELEESLFFYKERYCGKGREGKWKPFVASIGMTLTTADRYAKRYKARLAPTKLVSDKLCPEKEMNNLARDMAKNLAPRLKEFPVALTFLDKLREHLEAKLKTYVDA